MTALPTNIVVGQTGHAGLHNDANTVINALNSGIGASALGILGGLLNVTYRQVDVAARAPGGSAGVDVDLFTVPASQRALGLWTLLNLNLSPLTNVRQVKIPATDPTSYFRFVSGSPSIAALAAAQDQATMAFQAGDVISAHITATAQVLSAVAVVAGVVTYTGTFTGGAANGLVGKPFVIEGFVNAGNNVTITPTASTGTTIVGVATTQVNEIHAGNAYEQTGVNIKGGFYAFSDQSQLQTFRYASLTAPATDITVLTCPASQIVVNASTTLEGSPTNGLLGLANMSGGNLTISGNAVLNGGSPVTNNQFFIGSVVANLGVGLQNLNYVFTPGDYLSIHLSGTGKFMAWYNAWIM